MLFCLLLSFISSLIFLIASSFNVFSKRIFAFSKSFSVKNFVNLLDHQLKLVIDFANILVLYSHNFGIVNNFHFFIFVFSQE